MQGGLIRHFVFLILFPTFQQGAKFLPFSTWSRKVAEAAVAPNLTSSFRSFSCEWKIIEMCLEFS